MNASKLLWTLALVAAAFFIVPALAEDVTLTTFYPAPFGNYNQLTSTGSTNLATDAASLVGIGTAAPADKLHVVRAAADSVISAERTGAGASKVILSATADASAVGTTSNDPLNLITNNANRLTVTAAGNVGVGVAAPVDALDVTRNAVNSTIAAERTGANASKAVLTAGSDTAFVGTTSNDPLNLVTNNVSRVLVTAAGNVGLSTAVPNSPAPNGQAVGNLDANDVFLRGAGRWASQGGAPNIVIVTGPNAVTQSVANCPAGFVVTGGGFQQTTNHTIRQNMPTNNGRGWQVRTASTNRVTAYAVCAAQ